MTELLLTAALLGMLLMIAAPVLRVVDDGRVTGERSQEVVQNARIAVDEFLRALRQSRGITSVSGPGEAAGHIEYVDRDEALRRFDIDGASGSFRSGSPGAMEPLAGPVSAFAVLCYDSSNTLIPAPVEPARICSVRIDLTMTDADNEVAPVTASGKTIIRWDADPALITEIMYHSDRTPDKEYEWIELYNRGGARGGPIDFSGWSIASRTNSDHPDPLLGDDRFGTGSTVLPVGGYAVVTCYASHVHEELLVGRGFEGLIRAEWIRTANFVKSGATVVREGTKAVLGEGPGWIYQDCAIPARAASSLVSWWEKATAGTVGLTTLTVTIRDTSNVPIRVLYDGPLHADWTRHYADLTAFVGATVRIHFATTGTGGFWLDDCSLSWSRVDADALRLKVDDNSVVQQFRDDWDEISVLKNGIVFTGASYVNAWGADANGRTLQRVSAAGRTDDATNWREGPLHGTPGRANEWPDDTSEGATDD